MYAIGSLPNHVRIIIMLCVIICGISISITLLFQNTSFGLHEEELIDKDYVYIKNMDYQSNQMSTLNGGECEYSLAS